MSKPSSILLFAAGLGTRMAPLTKTTPKPMISVGGIPLLQHALNQCGDLKKVVNVHSLADQVKSYLVGTNVQISDETEKILETGGGLKRALPLLNSNPTLTMNTDAVWVGPNCVQALLESWDAEEMEALLLLVPTSQAKAHNGSGDFDLDESNRLKRGSDYVYTGLQIIRTDGLDEIDEDGFSMWRLWEGMLSRGTMYGAIYDGQWCDVGRPDSIAVAEEMLRGKPDV